MDPITHVAAGILLGQAGRDRFPASRWLVPLAAFAAWMPDLDNVVMLFGPEAYMRYHRGYTHSILGGALMAWLLAWITARFWRQAKRSHLFVLYFLCMLSHLFLDVITAYGTRIFLPFSDARVAISSVYIVDPLFTLALVALAVASFLRPAARRTLAVSGLALLLAWPALGFGVARLTEFRVGQLLAERGEMVQELHVQPDAFAPLWWKVVAREGDQYVLTGLCWTAPEKLLPEHRFERAENDELLRLGRQAAGVWSLRLVYGLPGQDGGRHPVRHAGNLCRSALCGRQSAGDPHPRPGHSLYPDGRPGYGRTPGEGVFLPDGQGDGNPADADRGSGGDGSRQPAGSRVSLTTGAVGFTPRGRGPFPC